MPDSMTMQTVRLKKLLLWVAVPLLVGGASALLSGNMGDAFSTLPKPPLSPPGWLFPIVWTVLYVLMGTAGYLISESHSPLKTAALGLYWIQLALNFLWSPLFFGLSMPILSLIVVAAMWVVVLLCVPVFYRINPLAGALMIPLLLWITFATYLNGAIVSLM